VNKNGRQGFTGKRQQLSNQELAPDLWRLKPLLRRYWYQFSMALRATRSP
jgi:hypothetical protein